MTTADRILNSLIGLTPTAQEEVLNFVEFLKLRRRGGAELPDAEWGDLSLAHALRGMHDDELFYDYSSLKDVQ